MNFHTFFQPTPHGYSHQHIRRRRGGGGGGGGGQASRAAGAVGMLTPSSLSSPLPPPPPPPPPVGGTSEVGNSHGPPGRLVIPGLEFHSKQWFDELLPSLEGWGQNILFLGQSNMGKSFFLKRLLGVVKPQRMVIISNTSPEQYRREGMEHFKHYSVMPESIEEMEIQPHTYVIIDDIRVMGLKHGSQRECLFKFFTMYSHHHKLNVFFLSQSFDNIKDMKINANFLYLFRFTDKSNIRRYLNTLFGGQCAKSGLMYKLYERLLISCERPVMAIDCSRNRYFTYCNDTALRVEFQ